MCEKFTEETTRHASERDRKIQRRRVVVEGRSTLFLWRRGIEPETNRSFDTTGLPSQVPLLTQAH